MKEIIPKISGLIAKEDIDYLGGRYTAKERIKKNGIGSTRTVYVSGVPAFDALQRNIEGEFGFVNFELLKEGLLIRQNVGQKNKIVGVRFDEIEEIQLLAHRIRIYLKLWFGFVTKPKIVHEGNLTLKTKDRTLTLHVPSRYFKDIKKYFEKEDFESLFKHKISDSPIKDDGAGLYF